MSCDNWSIDLTSGKTHYSDNDFGAPANMADDNLATYCQSMSYVSVDLSSNYTVSRIKLAVHNATVRTQLISDEPIFQGSNNSTNGSDGDWTTIMTIGGSDVDTPGSYPGWVVDKEFTNSISYNWYRLSEITKTVNNVYNEWEMFECEDAFYYFSGYVYEENESNPVSRKVYCYNRSDGTLINSTTSSGNGYYYLETTYSGSHFLIALDDESGTQYNLVGLDYMVPVTVS